MSDQAMWRGNLVPMQRIEKQGKKRRYVCVLLHTQISSNFGGKNLKDVLTRQQTYFNMSAMRNTADSLNRMMSVYENFVIIINIKLAK